MDDTFEHLELQLRKRAAVSPMIRHILVGALLCVAGCSGLSTPEDHPNVILILTDDQGYGDFGAAGNPVIRTPNLDAMASRSAQMTTFYVSPVCSPTRASLMTGRYNYRTRVVDTWIARAMMDPEEVTLAELLRDAGYATGIFGKWHLGDNYPMRPQDQGFEEVLVHRGGGIGQPSDPLGAEGKYTDAVLLHNGTLTQTEGYCTDVYFDYALAWIEERHRLGEPFFAYIPTNAPHGPFHDVPEDWLTEYQQMDLGNDQFPQEDGHPLPASVDLDRRARIFSMISNIDDNIGRLFDRLEALEVFDNTIVIFLTDNGPNVRRYVAGLRGNKSSVYEGGVRSPLFWQWPARLAAGRSSDRVAAHIDVLPSILDAVGVQQPESVRVDGRSFLPLLSGEDVTWPQRYLVIQSHRGAVPVRYHHFLIRDDRWKLVHHSGFGRESFEGEPRFELYDMESDPFEMTDLAREHPDVVARLRGAYDSWFDDVGSTRPDNYGKVPIRIGTLHESPTTLTRQDWQPTVRHSWRHPEANGFWDLEASAGIYDVTLHFPVAFVEGRVTLLLGDDRHTAGSTPGGRRHTFEGILLEQGPVRLQGELDDGTVTAGPWQVEIQRQDGR
jgi:arylsulfatase/arylsulfatase A